MTVFLTSQYKLMPEMSRGLNKKGAQKIEFVKSKYKTNTSAINAVIKAIEQVSNERWDKVISKTRLREYVEYRQLFSMIVKQIRGSHITLHQIQSELAARSHATVIHGIRQIEGLVQTNQETRYIYNEIIQLL